MVDGVRKEDETAAAPGEVAFGVILPEVLESNVDEIVLTVGVGRFAYGIEPASKFAGHRLSVVGSCQQPRALVSAASHGARKVAFCATGT